MSHLLYARQQCVPVVAKPTIMTGEQLTGLEHINRNGHMGFMDAPTGRIAEIHDKLVSDGYIKRNAWTKEWQPTDKGKRELSR